MTKEQKNKTPVQVPLTPNDILTTGKIFTANSTYLASRFTTKFFLTPRR